MINIYFWSETLWITKVAKIIHGFTYMQIFVSEKSFVNVYGMKSKKEFL